MSINGHPNMGTLSVWAGEDEGLPQKPSEVPVVHSVSFDYRDVDHWLEIARAREFEKGLVILNNSDQSIEVNFEEDYFDASCRQEGSSFVIPSDDARMLLRVSAQEE